METVDADLARDRPMQRLLMGEVGSGKTVVALYAMLRAVEGGAQAALMAPTETLAEQHFATLQKLMPGELVQAALLTGSTPAARRTDLLGKLATGELRLLVGTHALIEQAVEFDRLSVVVVDEQHRFGVNQRRALDRKAPAGLAPHVLHMTATPIPRTLALTAYGDLDVTVLRELPAGRRPIDTFVASSERERARAYERIREELRAGRQAFVVCPLVEESEALQARAATAEFERLQATELRDFRVVLLHGQKRPREKQEAMAAFAGGGADVLVATTVIEVGIDVPNASVMLVENAERYGISQLHQLRGRIGRGEHASVCVLFGPKESPRLRALAEHRDGFKLAEIDLRAARRGGDARHAPVRARPVQGRAAARGRGAARARPHARRARCSTPTPSCARPSTRCSRTRSTRRTARTRSSQSRRNDASATLARMSHTCSRRMVAALLVALSAFVALPAAALAKKQDLKVMAPQRLPRRGPDPARRRAGPGHVRAGRRAALPDRPEQRLPDAAPRRWPRRSRRTSPTSSASRRPTIWRRGADGVKDGSATPATQVVYDSTQGAAEGAAVGGHAVPEVVGRDWFDFEAPTALNYDVRITQRDVILVRKGSKVKVAQDVPRRVHATTSTRRRRSASRSSCAAGSASTARWRRRSSASSPPTSRPTAPTIADKQMQQL